MKHTIDPILIDFPDLLETERLLIRAPRQGDGQAVNESLCESLDALRPWMPWAQTAPTVSDTELVMRRASAEFILRENLMLLMFSKADGRHVGNIGLHRMDWSSRRFEIGYWIRTGQQGKGYVTEAVNHLTRFTFDELAATRIEIRCDTRNERSAAVARRTGYTLEATLHDDGLDPQGELRSMLLFTRLRDR